MGPRPYAAEQYSMFWWFINTKVGQNHSIKIRKALKMRFSNGLLEVYDDDKNKNIK